MIRETEEIRLENKRIQDFMYCMLGIEQESDYLNLIYESVFNKNSSELREKYGIGKRDNLRDCFTQEELKKVQNAEMLVSSLMEYGWSFSEIKDFVLKSANKLIET